MKKLIFSFALIVGFFTHTWAQSFEYSDIENILKDYIHGSSYNHLEQLESAFSQDAVLFLTIRGTFKKITPKEYSSFFKRKKGTFNNRVGTILSIEVYQDIATAKVEIFMTERRWRFIDLLLLKNTDNGWKIISKTTTKITTNAN